MKSEENKCEETLYEDNQVNTSKEVNNNEDVNVVQESKNGKSSTWRSVGVGMGLGILLGSTTSFVTSNAIVNQNGNNNGENTNDGGNHGGGSQGNDEGQAPEWTDGKVEVATTVNDEMSFSQAFGAARAEVGAGGAFEWRGNVYSTYTAEEWNGMSTEERNTYNEHFRWSRHEAATSQENIAETATEQVPTEEPAKPEKVTVEEVEEEPVVEVEVEVQEVTPEVEILGVVHDNETGANLGVMTVEEQEFLFIDVDDNGEFDVVVSDVNGDGQISENEAADISEHHMSVDDFESNSFGDSSMYASDDDMMDYTNDADAAYEI